MSTTRSRLAAVAVCASLGLGSVAIAAPSQAASDGAKSYSYDARTGKTNDPKAAALAKKLLSKLPADYKQRRAAFIADSGVEPGPLGKQVEAYLAKQECGPTELNEYTERLLAGIPDDVLFLLAIVGAFDYPTYDALLFGSRTDPDYAMIPGTAGKVRQTAQKARSFWDIKSGDIHVMAMHSEMVVDQPRVERILQALLGATPEDAEELAPLIIDLIRSVPNLRGGDSPIFSLNAFAFTAEGEPGLEGIGDKIVMGEGIIKALRWTGDIEVGPQMIFSHEFGHHIQFENDAYPATTSPENTRKMELMADAYGTYLDAHRKGLNFNADRVMKAAEVAHLVGDCAVDNNGHHGTPAERYAAAEWGAALAKKNGNTVLPSKQFEKLFLKALPGILAH